MSVLDRWRGTSRVLAHLEVGREMITCSVENARAVGVAGTVGSRIAASVRHSWLYRWLTAEPEPQVVVIDLRETYTVGPLLAVLDRGLAFVGPPVREAVLPRWRQSRTRAGLVRLARVIGASRTGRLLAQALEPPEVDHGTDEKR